jgi:threonine dehydratase
MTTLEEIRQARIRIGSSVLVSPCPRSGTFSEMSGNEVFLKLENLQYTGSYKERGALNRILTLSPGEVERGLIAASAGNHAQAVAYHATRLGMSAEICMPLATPLNKVMATRRFGAEVVLHGANYDEADGEARRRSLVGGLTFLHPFDDDAVIAGQGTLGLELLEQVPAVEVVFVAIGGGGLASGLACALKETKPDIRVIGVQAERLPSMKLAIEARKPVTVLPSGTTLADGIAVRRAGDRTLPMVQKYVDEIVTVEEEEIASAVLLMLEREKILAEGAGAAALAALLYRKTGVAGKNVVVVVSGGNMDVTLLSRIIERGLVKDGRLVRMRVHLPDYPGALHLLTGVLAELRTNIVATSYDRAYFGVNFGDTTIDLTMETRGPEHIKALSAALAQAGYVFERIV